MVVLVAEVPENILVTEICYLIETLILSICLRINDISVAIRTFKIKMIILYVGRLCVMLRLMMSC